jgi:hypothetical protein
MAGIQTSVVDAKISPDKVGPYEILYADISSDDEQF